MRLGGMAGIHWSSSLLGLLFLASAAFAAILPPRLSVAESEIHVEEGETQVVLECVLDVGDDPVAYRWLKNQQLVTAALGYAYRGYNKVLLALHKIGKEHSGMYVCEATNSAGADTAVIRVHVDSNGYIPPSLTQMPHTDDILVDIGTSLSDLLAEGGCHCDALFLLHASPDAPHSTMPAQANLVHTIADAIVSDTVRVGLMTYSDYTDYKLSFGQGTNQCTLREALRDLSHERWSTRLGQVFREIFKKFKKSKVNCKIMFLPIFGSLGSEGIDLVEVNLLKKLGIKILILEVTPEPLEGVAAMASLRGDGKSLHWRIPLQIWHTILMNMKYIPEELIGCVPQVEDIPGTCVNAGKNCTDSKQCRGMGHGCVDGVCRFLECNVHSGGSECCGKAGEYWCGDVTNQCTVRKNICDGRVQCMNGADESRCWANPCPQDKIARCQTSTLCLDLMDLCDGEPACPGGDDEDPRFCRSFPCPRDRPFRCRSGKCISMENVCDGVFKDCADGEDEDLDYCNRVHTCDASRPFKCDYGICIPESMLCDGTYNCLDTADELVCNGVRDACDDGSDETNCTTILCPVDRSFKCANGRCIDDWLVCDGANDCHDNSDEKMCNRPTIEPHTEPTHHTGCKADEFECFHGECIPSNQVCDGKQDCVDGKDESKCPVCPPNLPHRCRDGKCAAAFICNGQEECADGSDEINCTLPDLEEYDLDDYYGDYEGYTYDYYDAATDVTTTSTTTPTTTTTTTTTTMPEKTVVEPDLQPEAEPEPEVEDEVTPEPKTAVEYDEDYYENEGEVHYNNEGDGHETFLENNEPNEDYNAMEEEVETVLEEVEPEEQPSRPAGDVQSAASSPQNQSAGSCLGPTCTLLLVPLLVIGNLWTR